jgi:putative transposase
MMSPEEYSLWCEKLGLPKTARWIIDQIRSSDRPVRYPQSRVGNWTGFYNSKKVGRKVPFESRTVELPAIHDMEYDKTVLEYFAQPSKIPLRYRQNNRTAAFLHTPDFFVLREQRAGWEEWKSEGLLVAAAEKAPTATSEMNRADGAAHLAKRMRSNTVSPIVYEQRPNCIQSISATFAF